jgi:L-ribulose-5-phosphate 4-epimerase
MGSFDIDELKTAVWAANLELVKSGLVVLTWGNVSGIDKKREVIAIKPSGVPYDKLRPEDIVLVSLETGERLPGEKLRPSSDTPTHVALYRSFPSIGGVAHSHSRQATSWAQACREIPCYGTTHADTFHGPIPIIRPLTPEEIDAGYEWNTGLTIVEHFTKNGIDPMHVPGAILSHHAPFSWGQTPAKSVENAIVIEEAAAMALLTEQIKPGASLIPDSMLEKHFLRKHGPGAYYGQSTTNR